MSGALWLLIILVFVVVAFVMAARPWEHRYDTSEHKSLDRGAATLAIAALLMCGAPLVYEFVPFLSDSSYVVAIEKNGTWTKHPKGCWEGAGLELHTVHESSPLGRRIWLSKWDSGDTLPYSVTVKLADPVVYFTWEAQTGSSRTAQVAFHLEQFEHSEDPVLQECADPASADQQRRFSELLLTWLNERLARYGLTATEASFQARTKKA